MLEVKDKMLSLLCDLTYKEAPYWYGATRRPLKLDLIRPKSEIIPQPTLIWFCGGAFQQMDHHLWMPMMNWYAERGFTVASVEYRVGAPGQWPAPLADAWDAISYLRKNAKDFGIDPDRMAVMGESAGAYIASAVAAGICKPEDEKPVQAAVDFYGVTDPASMYTFEKAQGHNSIGTYMGGTPEEESDIYTKASVPAHIGPDSPAFLILHGEADIRVPLEQSLKLKEALEKNHRKVQLVTLPEAIHGDDRFYRKDTKELVGEFLMGVLSK